jgi:hypothetical protein
MLLTARQTVNERRHRRRGQPFGDTLVAACTAYLAASRAVDEALERREEVQRRRETTLEEDEHVERQADLHNGAMSNAAKDVRAADEASRRVALHAEADGVAVTGASTPDPDKALIPWNQAVAVARRIIELARARGDIS